MQPEVAIIGGGIGGDALAAMLASAGIDVRLVERTPLHRDAVRGEWIAWWEVAEVKRLGLYELDRSASGSSGLESLQGVGRTFL